MFRIPRGAVTAAAVLLAISALAAGCGGDDDGLGDNAGRQAPGESGTATGGRTIKVTGVDYAFEGLPAQVAAGTKVEFVNASSKEVHEFVAIRIPDDEKRPVSELVKLPESEAETVFGSAKPAAVLVAGPNRAPTTEAVGDGTLSSPGRYAVVCFVPTGADPAEFFEALQKPGRDGPPDVRGGPPHALNGMFAEVTVR